METNIHSTLLRILFYTFWYINQPMFEKKKKFSNNTVKHFFYEKKSFNILLNALLFLKNAKNKLTKIEIAANRIITTEFPKLL